MNRITRRLATGAALLLAFAASAAEPTTTSQATIGDTLLEKVKGLIGTWDAPMGNKVMTDTFRPFAFGTAVLGEEWLDGQQITSTIFYVVNGELRADHYCDYKNQPRYTAVPSIDPTVLDFQFREATNLDTHPIHFHGTQWHLVDATHLVQDWFVMGGQKPVSLAHLEFTRRAEPPVPAK